MHGEQVCWRFRLHRRRSARLRALLQDWCERRWSDQPGGNGKDISALYRRRSQLVLINFASNHSSYHFIQWIFCRSNTLQILLLFQLHMGWRTCYVKPFDAAWSLGLGLDKKVLPPSLGKSDPLQFRRNRCRRPSEKSRNVAFKNIFLCLEYHLPFSSLSLYRFPRNVALISYFGC